MATCLTCGKSGLFLAADRNRLCAECQAEIYPQLARSVEIIRESFELIEKSKNWKMKLGRCDTIEEILRRLAPYEEKGLKGMFDKPIRDGLREVDELRAEIYDSVAMEIYEDACNKVELASTPKTQVNAANRGALKLTDFEKQTGRNPTVERNKLKLRALAYQLEFKSFIDAAQKAEFKENFKKALDQYQEALYFLKTDSVDDSKQARTIAQLEQKITAIKDHVAGAKRAGRKQLTSEE